MLGALVAFSVRRRGVVIALSALAFGYGLFAASGAKTDVFPDFAPPQIVIQTEAPGLSSEDVEALVTRPVENSINGVAGLETLRSQSIQGLSAVTALFREGTDIMKARQLAGERLAEIARSLPQGTKAPAMAPLTSATSLVLVAGLESDKVSPTELRALADWELKPQLLAVPGVAKVVVFGGDVRQLQVRVDPAKLKAYGLGLDDVAEGAAKATGVRGAGFIENDAQRILLKTQGQSRTPELLAQAVVRRAQGLVVRIGDLGRVIVGAEPKQGDAAIMGRPGVMLQISGQYGANTLEVTRALEQALEELRPMLKSRGVTLTPDLFRPATFITRALANVRGSLLAGGALVAIVLALFLGDAVTAFISLTAIPLSLIIAVMVLSKLGISINTLTIGGLAIAIGEVVDDAIIDVENIHRRLKQKGPGIALAERLKTVFDASMEVRHSVVYATMIVIAVFWPVIRMTGVQGKLFAPLGLAYIFAILASLLIALTLTPALCATMLKGKALERGEPRWVGALKSLYEAWLSRIMDQPRKVISAAVILCAAAVAAIPFFGGAFLPEFREGHFVVHMSAIPGTSLHESMRLGSLVTKRLLDLPEVRSVAQAAGRAESSDDTWGPHYSELQVDLKPLGGEEAEFAQGKIRNALAAFPGLSFAVKPFLTERIEETVSGLTAQVVVKIFGEDLDVLDAKAREVLGLVSAIPGATDAQVETQPSVPELHVTLKPQALVHHGVAPVTVLDTVQTAYQGKTVSQVFEGNRVTDVVVLLGDREKVEPEIVGDLPVRNPDGAWVPLRELAEVTQRSGRYVVVHENARRRQTVSCNVAGRDLDGFVQELKRRLAGVSFPSGTYAVVTGAAEAKSQARRELLVQSLAAACVIILLLWMALEDARNLGLVLCNLPFALVGGVLAVFFTGGWLSLGSLIGFVTLFGITTRNSIMLISHYEHLVRAEGMEWGREASIKGATERLVPILMTALVTGLGLLPMAIGSGQPGREIEGPLAIVILGGLATSTALNLLVLPTLALRFGRFERREGEVLATESVLSAR